MICKIQPELTIDNSDIGFSDLFAQLFKKELRYNVNANSWYMYDGIRWCEDTGEVFAAEKAKEMISVLLVYAARPAKSVEQNEKREKFFDEVIKYRSYMKRTTLLKDAKSRMAIRQSDFNQNKDLFNCLNCTINLKTLETHKHTPDDFISKVSGCDYDPDADISKWTKFINEILQDDTEKAAYLQRICGYTLTAYTQLEKAFFLYGATTRNGKSTFTESFRSMMGDYAGVAQPETIAQSCRGAGRATPEIAKLDGVRFLNMPEPSKNMLLDVAYFKKLTGGDTITARALYSNDFDFLPQFKLFINCNSLPRVTDNTLFTSDRVRIITFDRHFKNNERNLNLKKELKQDQVLSSILNWAIVGLKSFNEVGENPPECVKAATNAYKANTDKILQFFKDCMERSDQNCCGSTAYIIYQIWCKENNYAIEGKRQFFDALREKNYMCDTGTVFGKSFHNVIMDYDIVDKYKAELEDE
jgi:putative DNA primase/helicase